MAVPAERITEKGRTKLLQLTTFQEGYATSFDGTSIHYQSVGKGMPIVCCNGLACSTFFWKYFEKHFRRSYQVVTWDYRGHGQSSLKKSSKNYTIPALVQDLRAVLDALKIEKAILAGHSLGTQVILELYRRHPKRVAAILSCFGTYGHLMDYFYNSSLSPLIFRLVYFLGTTFPQQGNLISRIFLSSPLAYWAGGIFKVMNTGMMSRAECEEYVNHVLSVNPLLFSKLLKSMHEATAEDILPKVKAPTLIIAGEEDQFTPSWISKKMHRLVRGSELLTMHKATHAGLVEQPDLFNLWIEKFLQENVQQKFAAQQ